MAPVALLTREYTLFTSGGKTTFSLKGDPSTVVRPNAPLALPAERGGVSGSESPLFFVGVCHIKHQTKRNTRKNKTKYIRSIVAFLLGTVGRAVIIVIIVEHIRSCKSTTPSSLLVIKLTEGQLETIKQPKTVPTGSRFTHKQPLPLF